MSAVLKKMNLGRYTDETDTNVFLLYFKAKKKTTCLDQILPNTFRLVSLSWSQLRAIFCLLDTW